MTGNEVLGSEDAKHAAIENSSLTTRWPGILRELTGGLHRLCECVDATC
jgi:hypothetical protein